MPIRWTKFLCEVTRKPPITPTASQNSMFSPPAVGALAVAPAAVEVVNASIPVSSTPCILKPAFSTSWVSFGTVDGSSGGRSRMGYWEPSPMICGPRFASSNTVSKCAQSIIRIGERKGRAAHNTQIPRAIHNTFTYAKNVRVSECKKATHMFKCADGHSPLLALLAPTSASAVCIWLANAFLCCSSCASRISSIDDFVCASDSAWWRESWKRPSSHFTRSSSTRSCSEIAKPWTVGGPAASLSAGTGACAGCSGLSGKATTRTVQQSAKVQE
jgi:hypothetical protein